MLKTLKNAWKVADLKNKLLFTLLIVVIYRLGANIPVPFVDADAFTIATGSIFQYMDLLSGGALSQATVFALSVNPYITSSIVMQLLTIAIPALERMSKEGEEGQKKIKAITRWVTMALALVTAYGYTKVLLSGALTFSKADGFVYYVKFASIVACYCAGACIITWLAEKIDEYGMGNGISMILFANIVSRVPQLAIRVWGLVFNNGAFGGFNIWGLLIALVVLAVMVAIIALIVCVTNSERRIPIQYAKRVVGRKMYGGQGTNLPLKVNMTGVMPIIFASSIATLPATITAFFPNEKWLANVSNFLSPTSWIYVVLSVLLIVAFSYFYVLISFNPIEVSNNIRDNGGAVPGIRPGKPTADYIKKVLNRITAIGAIFLCFIACFPTVVSIIAGYFMPESTNYFSAATIELIAGFAFGGTSILIVIGVVLETFHQLEAELTMRNYKGFLD